MDNKKFQAAYTIAFGILAAGLFYLMPYIAWHTMEGDKTDIVMGMAFGFIPLGLLLLSLLYGFLAKKVIMPACMASMLGIPAIFIPVVAGNTAIERLLSLMLIAACIFIITCVGTASGMFIRRLLSQRAHGYAQIHIEEIPVERIDEFWSIHMRYLIEDEIITDEEDREYFQGCEYRDVIRQHMLRLKDRHHMVYFVRDGIRIGAAQYNTYQSEDGKCFILDFWIFPEYRGNFTGHRCFEALKRYTQADGAAYYELNCTRENAHRFWLSLGFADHGVDEDEMPLMIRK